MRGQGPGAHRDMHRESRLLPQPLSAVWDRTVATATCADVGQPHMTAGERVCETHSAATLSLGTGTSGDDPGAFTSLWRGGPWLNV